MIARCSWPAWAMRPDSQIEKRDKEEERKTAEERRRGERTKLNDRKYTTVVP